MSIERYFISKNDGNFYRISPSIGAGELGLTHDISHDTGRVILMNCHNQDFGAMITELEADGIEVSDSSEAFIIPKEAVRNSDNTVLLASGELFKQQVTLEDGDQGTFFAQQFDSENVYLN